MTNVRTEAAKALHHVTEDQTMVVATVRFLPGARTAWHSHKHGQYLRVTQGVGRFGGRDGKIIEVHPGQTLYTPPGEEKVAHCRCYPCRGR